MSRVKGQETEIDNFYKLKQTYDNQYKTNLDKIMNSGLSDSDKRERIKQIVRKCINCKRPGGTVFEVSNTFLKARCNAEPRCNLSIDIDKGVPVTQATRLINALSYEIENNKTMLMETKIQHALGMLDDEEASERFMKLKEVLELLTKEFVRTEEHIIGLTNNIDKQEAISQNRIILFEQINQFKDLVLRFKETGQEGYMRDAIRLASEEILPKASEIRRMKYDVNTVVKDEITGIARLIQEPYTLEQMEISIPQTI